MLELSEFRRAMSSLMERGQCPYLMECYAGAVLEAGLRICIEWGIHTGTQKN